MKIINKTHWNTSHLRSILQLCAEMELEPAKRRRVHVEIVYAGKRHNSSSGHAQIGGTRCRVRIPKGVRQPDSSQLNHYRRMDEDPSYVSGYTESDRGQLATNYLKNFDDEASLKQIKLAFASVACHEFAHLRGMTHRQMPAYYTWASGWEDYVGWAGRMTLEVSAPKDAVATKGSVSIQEKRRETAVQHVTEWEKKFKTAQTKLKKWRGKVHYYDRALAAKQAGR